MRPIVWMSEPLSRALRERLSTDVVVVGSAQEFMDSPRDAKTVSFIDNSTLAQLDEIAERLGHDPVPPPEWRKLVAAVSLGPVIVISSEPVYSTMKWLQPHPWLAHTISAAMLNHPMATEHLNQVMAAATTIGAPRLMDWLGPKVSARRIRLARASKRGERLDRMGEFFASKNVSEKTVGQLRVIADEMLTNVFYNAPLEAGAVHTQIPRTQDVSLPEDSACDLVYGCRDDLAFVRVRDPFGSLSRARLAEAVAKCSRAEREDLANSPPGSGVGLWRIFTTASLVGISVHNNHHTEFLVGIIEPPVTGQRPFAFHLFFKDGAKRRLWKSADQDTGVTDPSFNTSVSIVVK